MCSGKQLKLLFLHFDVFDMYQYILLLDENACHEAFEEDVDQYNDHEEDDGDSGRSFPGRLLRYGMGGWEAIR